MGNGKVWVGGLGGGDCMNRDAVAHGNDSRAWGSAGNDYSWGGARRSRKGSK